MKTREKFTILLAALIALFIIGFNSLRDMRKTTLALLSQNELTDKSRSFDKIVELKGKPLKDMVDDYTFWDEMVNFIYFKDMQWAKKNINEAIFSFNSAAAWVYNPDFALIYSTNNINSDKIKDLPLVPKKFLYEYFLKQQNRFLHFFTKIENGIWEIRAASIHPTADPQRTTSPRGFFFVAKLWDENYINELSYLTNSQVSLNTILTGKKNPGLASSPGEGIIYFSKPLPQWEGNEFAQLEVKTISESIKSFSMLSGKYSVFFSVFVIFFIAISCIAIIKWINEPLYLISRTLKNQEIDSVKKLLPSKTEFGEICRMIEIYFKQKETLEEEINARKRAENALRINKEKFNPDRTLGADGNG